MLHRGIRRAWYKYVAPQIESSFVAMYHYYFESLKDFIAAFNPHSEAFQGDYANYTNIQLKKSRSMKFKFQNKATNRENAADAKNCAADFSVRPHLEPVADML